MSQTTLFPDTVPSKRRTINVASVPHRSLFRYPGGKTWLVPWVRRWLNSLTEKPEVFIEPFAGGGIIGLTAAFEQLARHVILVELDEDIASVWKTILSNQANWLVRRILGFEFTPDTVHETIRKTPSSLREQAFQTILRNRVCHGGIMAPGSGLIKKGENGKGLRSRWYPETLAKRIQAIHQIRERITFICADGLEVTEDHLDMKTATFFFDPPYTAGGKRAGTRLYKYFTIDHKCLFTLAAQVQGDFIMTYDAAPEAAAMAYDHGFEVEEVPMTNTRHAYMTELLISRNLSWICF